VRVLVTGAFGFVGTALVRRLAASGHEVRALTSRPPAETGSGPRPSPAERRPSVEVVRGDVRDAEAMRRAVEGVDGVCHLAALTSVRAAQDRAAEYWAVNHGGAATIARAAVEEARHSGRAVRFVLASSGAVYGRPELQPIPEDLPFTPTNDYGETKRAAEGDVLDVPSDGRFGAVALRLFNAAGATVGWSDGQSDGQSGGQSGWRTGDPETLIPKALAVARGTAACLEINGDGTAVRDFVHVDDAARAFELALAYAEPDRRAVFNVGATGASVLDVVQVAREVTGHPIPVVHRPSRGEAPRLLADTRRARATLGWQPQNSDLHRIIADAWHALGSRPRSL
jgi:UDP-glucose 4-epimerase